MKSNTKIAIVVVVVILAIAGIVVAEHKNEKKPASSSTASSASSSATAVEASTVTIKDFAFGPQVIKVKAGTTVTWTNTDDVSHTVTADKASSNAPDSTLFAKGGSYSFQFNAAGTYTYHCVPHPYMHGTVIVTE